MAKQQTKKPSESARKLPVRAPLTGEQADTLHVMSAAEIAAAAAAARHHQALWAARSVAERCDVIRRLADAMDAHAGPIGDALSVDTGRRALALQEISGTTGAMRRWAEAAPALLAETRKAALAMPDVEIVETAMPYPVVGAISPWNFPLLLSFIDVTPALLAGCSALIKPSEVTPRFAKPVAQAIAEIEELTHVLGFVDGDGEVGAQLLRHVDVVAFTGSVATGRKVAMAAAEQFIPAFLELGGKDPAIVLEGSDIDRATTSILRASIAATGQACQSLERLYVHRSQHDEFVDSLVSKAEAVALTRETETGGIVGPLIFDKQAAIINAQLEAAVAAGAKIRTGGMAEELDGGWWIRPTVLSDVNHDMAIMREETFGPVMPVMAFDTPEEAIRLANDSIYGLSGAVFGPSDEVALDVARSMAAGGISVNDAGMTTMLFETEKSAFAASGMGPSRVGPSGLTRFLRRQSLYVNRGEVMPVQVLAERDAHE